ncbi:MAG: hypothetical protein HKO62_13200 [Gammaproteobacteria bacterium]|nr:hypothetical protein [Gammaproteobacteria bacterium]
MRASRLRRLWPGAGATAGRAVVLLCLLAQLGCESEVKEPDLGFIYDALAMNETPERNPVIVIPGVLGSRLSKVDDGSVVWGAFGAGFSKNVNDAQARDISLPMRDGASLDELRDDVEAVGALDRVKIKVLGLSVELQAYHRILATLGVGGYRDEEIGSSGAIDYGEAHFTCFQFAYDWRRDLVESAALLDAYIEEKRRYVQQEIERRFGLEDYPVKFDIVAHSMGGLLTRYFLRYGNQGLPDDGSLPALTWDGARHVERVILIGTPNAGSVDSFKTLVEGVRLLPGIPQYNAAIIGTMPSLYQLIPRARHQAVVEAGAPDNWLDLTDPEVWERQSWGLANPALDADLAVLLPEAADAAERRAIALDHQRKSVNRATQFHQAIDVPAAPPPGLMLHLVAGDAVATNQTAAAASDGSLEIISTGPGDGSVLRSSALMDERVGSDLGGTLISPVRWSNVQFLFSDHLGLTKDPAFADNVLFLLLEAPRYY